MYEKTLTAEHVSNAPMNKLRMMKNRSVPQCSSMTTDYNCIYKDYHDVMLQV